MLDICGQTANDLDLKFNCAKCKCLVIGCMRNITRATLVVNGNDIQWTDSLKYLGVVIISATHFSVDLSDVRRKYFIALNTVLNKAKNASELSKLYIVEAHCLPLLLYGVEALNVPSSQVSALGCWWNAVFRKLFFYNMWESVKMLIYFLQRLDMHHMIIQRKLLFIRSLEMCGNNLISNISKLFKLSPEYAHLMKTCKVDLSRSGKHVRVAVHSRFNEIVERQL
jgi:hypothetical protein